ncbi:bifunctional [glutamine synthetase] adenylyltransferase/[glutamine synthetase]-adenylyl-L-tyrosine phosphorylase [Brevibacterium album]|uniref:bifunctional [glutamine synthetase] adenylyltransferase/[glutamine synthetase]-adenylyl-L-tyrosine phosphorylase n=1 Tax=Brevibacterium album TaxID=417948 RepID=UPI0004271E11|nr:bifunctional [glutamine synthetase] adenylyltransferase/[glutamine synthetase]-adenylyl-L-tyrosine phosphorylase [Brevibacterium album]
MTGSQRGRTRRDGRPHRPVRLGAAGRGGDPSRSATRPSRARTFLREADALLGTTLDAAADEQGLLGTLADAEAAALGLLRLAEAVAAENPPGVREALAAAGTSAPEGLGLLPRLLQVTGASDALTDHLVRHPESVLRLVGHGPLLLHGGASAPEALRAALVAAVGDLIGEDAVTALRRSYRDHVLELVADDLLAPEPVEIVDEVSRVLSDLAAAAIEAGLTIARAELDPAGAVGIAVIAMGKCGAGELNYVSDVDVVYVHAGAGGPHDPEPPGEEATRTAESMVARLTEIIGGPAAEPALWELDAALRPEGRAGRLLRTVDEFEAYYTAVAESWEFQALLKARPVAGDAELGRLWAERTAHFVWEANRREGFVEGVRAMRRRVVDLLPAQEAARQIKLGIGGLRDVEFSAQLLQLVHGELDEAIRVRGTLEALAALGERGYIAREDAAGLAECYRFLRVVEHRLQIPRLLRTALLPETEERQRLLARTVFRSGERTPVRLTQRLADVRRRVRVYHEQIFYRPILDAASRDTVLTSLTEAEARARLAAFGFQDPKTALGHIHALSAGVSRAAVIHRQVLPAMLGWLARGVDPDAGLLAFRQLGESLRDSSWYLRLLRDSGSTVHSLAGVLSLSAYTTGLLQFRPDAVAWLDDPDRLLPREADALRTEALRLVGRHGGRAGPSLRGLYSRELLRTALADVLGQQDLPSSAAALSTAADVYLDAVLASVRAELDGPETPDYEFAVIAMGRLGGAEIGYFSDADVMYCYRPADPEAAKAAGLAGHVKKVALALAKEASRADRLPGIEADSDLRPEGRSGPLVRTLDSYAAYYAKWSEPWEAQALLRARPVAGSRELGDDFTQLIDPLRYPEEVPESSVRQMRRLKARMESERLPRGADRKTHLKLGHGGLSDVEWTVQLIQLRYGHAVPGLRTTSTLPALDSAILHGLVGPEDGRVLREAWMLASGLRSAAMLYRGRTAASLPVDRTELEACARLLGYEPGSAQRLAEDYRAAARHARKVVERLFFGFEADEIEDPWAREAF